MDDAESTHSARRRRLPLTGAFWYRAHAWVVRWLPRPLVPPLVILCAVLGQIVLGDVRRAVASNLAVVLGPAGFWRTQVRVFENLRSFVWCLQERYEGLCTDRTMHVEFEGLDHWQGVIDRDEGFLLLTAHVGHWEAGSMLPADHFDRGVHVVREEEEDPAAQVFLRDLLQRRGGARYTMHFAGGDPASLGTRLVLALRRGDVVAIQGDRPARQGRRVTAQLFGQPYEVPEGPVALAQAAEVPILPCFVYRTGRSAARVVFRPTFRVERTADRRADRRAAVERMAAEVEGAIRREPHQWFCFREVWASK